ncbi:lytic transglycosylase domain-containing protein [Polaromonas sp. JS666]|uniref:lytic transglycosylase domain-containing protein n=1 Tax=Polaromonas sp. (strain JS666 / ATCC BAA-500) TaxID=296591 RepID=UPI000883183D|nr:lytic transglycosylase domain-containing protein [Polaromonas sp. JS666]SDN20512.1 Soluble lytic murein transglycosylase [Polaromonas sp. JS666]
MNLPETFLSFLRRPLRALGLPLAAMGLAALFASPAHADIWGYVDKDGIAHFSAVRLDDRYELFFRGGESFSADGSNTGRSGKAVGSGANRATGVAAAPPKLLAYFDVSPNYKAVKHLLREASATHGIDYELLQALIATESGFNTQAVSPKGAVGLMQLIPPTAERYGVRASKDSTVHKKLTDPKTNIRAGSSYLSDLIAMFPGQLELAIAAYNAGEGAVQRAGNKIPNYPETKNYVKTVMQLYNHLKPPSMMAPGGRVRMEMMGGSTGRGNMVPTTVAATTTPEAPPERN